MPGGGRRGHQQQSVTEEEAMQGYRETSHREDSPGDAVLTQDDVKGRRSDTDVGEGSLGCQKVSRRGMNLASSVFSQ